jgi:hypothetical protein
VRGPSVTRAGGRIAAVLGLATTLTACASSDTPGPATIAPAPIADAVPATISKPDGPGPFPAVVILHD